MHKDPCGGFVFCSAGAYLRAAMAPLGYRVRPRYSIRHVTGTLQACYRHARHVTGMLPACYRHVTGILHTYPYIGSDPYDIYRLSTYPSPLDAPLSPRPLHVRKKCLYVPVCTYDMYCMYVFSRGTANGYIQVQLQLFVVALCIHLILSVSLLHLGCSAYIYDIQARHFRSKRYC